MSRWDEVWKGVNMIEKTSPENTWGAFLTRGSRGVCSDSLP